MQTNFKKRPAYTDASGAEKQFMTFDRVICTQAEFKALIADPTWFGAVSVAFIGDGGNLEFTLSSPNNGGVKIPQTVKQIRGFNDAKIRVTNFYYNSTYAKGGLWYTTLPTQDGTINTTPLQGYSISDLSVDCTGSTSGGFSGYGFNNCVKLTNCISRGVSSIGSNGYGFISCIQLTNCTGKGAGASMNGTGMGFSNCIQLMNCIGAGSGKIGYGFNDCSYASCCKEDIEQSTTNIWGGTNTKIDWNSCQDNR